MTMETNENDNSATNPDNSTEKKTWEALELKVLDIPTATQNGMGRLQPGEGINFYRNS